MLETLWLGDPKGVEKERDSEQVKGRERGGVTKGTTLVMVTTLPTTVLFAIVTGSKGVTQ